MLSTIELYLCDEIIEVCNGLYDRNLLAAADGNVSHRISEDRIIITPSGKPKKSVLRDEMAVVSIDGSVVSGTPSSEVIMHLEVYRNCPLAKAVVHAHPPTAIAWTVARPEMDFIPSNCLSELILAVGELPVAKYARPGTLDMGTVLRPFLADHRAILLSRHGAITWGESLTEAQMGMERIEHVCEILYKAQMLGGLTTLPDEEVSVLKEMRKNLGPKLL